MLTHSNPGWSKNSISLIDKNVTLAIKTAIVVGKGLIKPKVPVDKGQLVDSIESEMVNNREGRIGTNVEYATYVEYGTRKMKAQPYMRPGAFELKRKLGRIISNILKIGVRKLRG